MVTPNALAVLKLTAAHILSVVQPAITKLSQQVFAQRMIEQR
jgi:hypothetical protein